MEKKYLTHYYNPITISNLINTLDKFLFKNPNDLELIEYKDSLNGTLYISFIDKNEDVKHVIQIASTQIETNDYALNIDNYKNSVINKESNLFNYYQNLGVRLGRNILSLMFGKVPSTTTYLDILIDHYSDFYNDFKNLINIDKNDANDTNYFFIDINKSIFNKKMEEIYNICNNNGIVPRTYLIALTYLSLSFIVFGLIGGGRVKESMTLNSYFEKLAIDKKVAYDLINNTNNFLYYKDIESTKDYENSKILIESILQYFFVFSNYYMYSSSFYENNSDNVILNALYNLGEGISLYDDDNEEKEWKGVLDYTNIVKLNDTVYLYLCDWDIEDHHITAKSEEHSPLLYYKALDSFEIYNKPLMIESKGENITNIFISEYIKKHIVDEHTSFKNMKIYLEKCIKDKEILTINPCFVYKLLCLATICRYYEKNKEYRIDALNTCELLIYSLYQLWFNRKDYTFATTKSKYYTNNISNYFEVYFLLISYLQNVFYNNKKYINLLISTKFDTNYYIKCLYLNNEIDKSDEMKKIIRIYIGNLKNSIKSANLNEIEESLLLKGDEMGLVITSLLENPNSNFIIDKIYSRNGYIINEETLKEGDNIPDLLEKLKVDEKILGCISDNEIYKKINTNILSILHSSLNFYQKFYLVYCLNYYFIRNYYYETTYLEENTYRKILLIANKEKNKKDEKNTLEEMDYINENLHLIKEKIPNKYGF